MKAKKTFSSLQDKQKIFTENVSSIVRDGLIFKNLFVELLPEPIMFLLTFEKTSMFIFFEVSPRRKKLKLKRSLSSWQWGKSLSSNTMCNGNIIPVVFVFGET